MNRLQFFLYAGFLSYFLSLNFVYLTLLFLAFTGSVRRLYERQYVNFSLLANSSLTIPVSVVIPAFNEELGVAEAVYSAVSSIYPEFEVILVNDGSTDRTLSVMRQEFELEAQAAFYRRPLPTRKIRQIYRSKRFSNLWVIDKDNGGKADALNAGINLARYRYVVTTDADSIFEPRGLLGMIRIVNDDPGRTVGMGGQIRVGNGLEINRGQVLKKRLPRRLVTNFQVVEYLGSFLGNRLGWSELNAVLVVAGAFGLWRRDAVIELGGMTSETTHEDIEFTFRIHEAFRRNRQPYRIVFLPDPIVWTEVPSSWRGLFGQRRRWQRVVGEVFWRYRRMFLNPRYGTVGMLGMPYLLIYEIAGPLIEIAGYVLIIWFLIAGALSLDLLLLFLLVSFGLTGVVRMAGVFVEQYSFHTYPLSVLPRLFFLALLEGLGYRQFVSLARTRALFDRGNGRWERVERHGF
jgi:cellulose synthase/poly-beta-1,6-N-acetylglucosamine synthase-like glycosyltransferase